MLFDYPRAFPGNKRETRPLPGGAEAEAMLAPVEALAYGGTEADGGRSSMVELQIVVLAVAGSSPVGRPAFLRADGPGQSDSDPVLVRAADRWG